MHYYIAGSYRFVFIIKFSLSHSHFPAGGKGELDCKHELHALGGRVLLLLKRMMAMRMIYNKPVRFHLTFTCNSRSVLSSFSSFLLYRCCCSFQIIKPLKLSLSTLAFRVFFPWNRHLPKLYVK